LWGIGQASLPGEVPFRHPQVALTGSWAGAASSGLRQHACGGPQSAASGRSRNFVSTPLSSAVDRGSMVVGVDLNELAGH
jgi:hypothetical protein